MSLLDDLRALASTLPADVKPVAAEVVDVLGAVVHTLESNGISAPATVSTASDNTVGSTVADITPGAPVSTEPPASAPAPAVETPAEPETVGSTVADITPGPPAAPEADPLATVTVEELTDELAKRQQAAIQLADAQKTQHEVVE